MILKFLIFLAFIPNSDPELENYIGKHIDDVFADYSITPVKGVDKNICIVNLQFKYFGKTLNNLVIKTDLKGFIEEVSFYLEEIINQSFFEQVSKEKGTPITMLKIDKMNVTNNFKSKDGTILKESNATTKECASFNENPLLIIWKSKDYFITIEINRPKNRTKITISKNSLF